MSRGITTNLNDKTDTFTVGLITNSCDTVNAFFLHQTNNMLMNLSLINHVWKLSYDNSLTAIFHLFDFSARTKDNWSLPCFVSPVNTGLAHNQRSCWKIWTRQDFHDVTSRCFWIIHDQLNCINRLTKIMRWNIGCHPNCNPCCSIYKQVGKASRKNYRLSLASIIVISIVNSIFVNITKHLKSDLAHTCFCITLGSGPISVHRTEVSMTVYQHVAIAPPLSHPHHRFINRGVTMRVVFTHDIPCDTSWFLVRLIRRNA